MFGFDNNALDKTQTYNLTLLQCFKNNKLSVDDDDEHSGWPSITLDKENFIAVWNIDCSKRWIYEYSSMNIWIINEMSMNNLSMIDKYSTVIVEYCRQTINDICLQYHHRIIVLHISANSVRRTEHVKGWCKVATTFGMLQLPSYKQEQTALHEYLRMNWKNCFKLSLWIFFSEVPIFFWDYYRWRKLVVWIWLWNYAAIIPMKESIFVDKQSPSSKEKHQISLFLRYKWNCP